jgi:hypothetical protein
MNQEMSCGARWHVLRTQHAVESRMVQQRGDEIE